MSLLAAVVLAAASARIESVYLTTADQRLAVRVAVSGAPGMVAVHREGAAARVSIRTRRAWAWGESTSRACSIPGRRRSPA